MQLVGYAPLRQTFFFLQAKERTVDSGIGLAVHFDFSPVDRVGHVR